MTKVFKIMKFPFSGDKNKGLFNFLRESTRYPISQSIIVVNSSLSNSKIDTYYTMKPFGTIAGGYSWMSDNVENSWLMITFPKFKVKIDEYTTLSHAGSFPKSWCLEAKNNEDTQWTNVSYVKDRTTMPSDAYFHGETETRNYFSSYKLKMLGSRQDNSNNYCYEIRSLEFFGSIQISKGECTISYKGRSPLSLALTCIIVST